MNIAMLAGGSPHAHDFDQVGAALTSQFSGQGHNVRLLSHPDEFATELARGATDVAVIHALFWQMQGQAYDEWRDEWSYQTSVETRSAITGFVTSGGGLLGMHTAPICFDDWPGWLDVLGARWQWGRSWHPEPAPIQVDFEPAHPLVANGLEQLQIVDELYCDVEFAPDVQVLATAPDAEGHAQPVIVTRSCGEGRVAYNALGHDRASLECAGHIQLTDQLLDWLAGPTRTGRTK